jgi:hypothetical protein
MTSMDLGWDQMAEVRWRPIEIFDERILRLRDLSGQFIVL